MSDTHIHCYEELIMLRNNVMHCDRENRVVLLHPQFIARLTQPDSDQDDYSALVRWVMKLRTPLTYSYVIPVHVNKNHWFVVVVDIHTGEIWSVESMPHDRSVVVALIKWFFERHWKEIGYCNDAPEWSVRLLTQPETPQQDDSVNCCVFACVVMDLYLANVRFSDMKNLLNQRNIGEISRRMALFMDAFNYMCVCLLYVFSA